VNGYIDRAFDWGAFEVLLSAIHGSTKGAPGYPPVTMLKIILLQQWYTLSDPAAEEAVRDRLSFRRFCRIPLDRETPDHASIWRFRQTIDKLGLSQALLGEANRQLDARGLIVNINDVLFDFNKYTLKPGAREKLAKVAGILLAYPGLKVQLEGHTDSVGTEEYNMKLSNERAGAVRDYLLSQSVLAANLTATGLGKASPVATNDTAAGRQQNRRVEMVVSGDPIGVVAQ